MAFGTSFFSTLFEKYTLLGDILLLYYSLTADWVTCANHTLMITLTTVGIKSPKSKGIVFFWTQMRLRHQHRFRLSSRTNRSNVGH